MIGIDAGNSLDRPPTGVAVYARNLIWQLARLQPGARFGWYFRLNRYFRSLPRRLPANAERRLLEGPAMRRNPDGPRLFHGLNQRLPDGLGVPSVATFHDLFALTGEYSTEAFRARFAALARETADRADHVIAVSEYTARQVRERLQVPRSRISVVHHGVDRMDFPGPARRRKLLDKLGVSPPYILHMGALQVRKNIERSIEAFEASGGQAQLVLAGPKNGYGAAGILRRARASHRSARIVLTGHVGDEARATLYAEAELLLFPSLDEGFGLPVVEAFSAGLPVIAARAGAMPEVAGDAALMVDPLDLGQIKEALRQLLSDRQLRSKLRRRGFARARQFSWERCARETWRVYRNLLDG